MTYDFNDPLNRNRMQANQYWTREEREAYRIATEERSGLVPTRKDEARRILATVEALEGALRECRDELPAFCEGPDSLASRVDALLAALEGK